MDVVAVFQKVVTDPSMSWVLFKHGTCVMLLNPEEDFRKQAITLLKNHGPVIPGTPSGDFDVTRIPDIQGWIVTGNFPGIMIYVSFDEAKNKDDVEVGLIGRNKRERDTKELDVMHVEDKTKNA